MYTGIRRVVGLKGRELARRASMSMVCVCGGNGAVRCGDPAVGSKFDVAGRGAVPTVRDVTVTRRVVQTHKFERADRRDYEIGWGTI